MNRTQQLDALFDEWERLYPGNFSRDGIICEDDFAAARFRILFILKETNAHKEDIRAHGKKFSSQYATWRNLAYWSRGILDGFPAFKEIVSHPEVNRAALAKTAVINLKKTSGKASAIYHEIEEFIADEKNQNFFTQEIGIVNPDVMVCCGDVVGNSIKRALFPNLEWQKLNDDVFGVTWERCWIFLYYHPQYRRWDDEHLYDSLITEVRSCVEK